MSTENDFNYSTASDEDFMRQMEEEAATSESYTEEESDTDESEQEENSELDTSEDDNNDDESEESESENDEDEDEFEEDSDDYSDDDDADSDDDTNDEESDEEPEKDNEQSDEARQLAELLAPLKAAGSMHEIKDPQDLRKFAQMGIDYFKKMNNIKPAVRLQQTLNKNKVSEDDINHFIDIKNGSKTAIAQLLKSHNIDPMDLDIDKEASQYQKTDHQVSESEVNVREVLDELSSTQTFNQLTQDVVQKWDNESLSLIEESPGLLRDINEHMNRTLPDSDKTIYNAITSEIERQRMLGNLSGVSDLKAYHHIGSQLFADSSEPDQQQSNSMADNTKRDMKDKPDPKTAERRRKAAKLSKPKRRTRQKEAPTNKLEGVKALKGSDEEFMQIMEMEAAMKQNQ